MSSSLFDSAVYQAKAAIPWATIDFESFMRDLAQEAVREKQLRDKSERSSQEVV